MPDMPAARLPGPGLATGSKRALQPRNRRATGSARSPLGSIFVAISRQWQRSQSLALLGGRS